jgi:uncharacterized membrane protein YfcA
MRRPTFLSFAVMVVCAATAVAGFMAGRLGAPDLAAARQAGALIGARAGTHTGAALGRRAGYKAGFSAGYHHAYTASYLTEYRKAAGR